MSHTLLILKIYTTFTDVQMMLKWFFDNSTGFRFQRSVWECSVHICSCPCVDHHLASLHDPNDFSINSRWMNFRKFINSCCYVEFSKLKNKHNKWWGLNAYFLIPSVVIGGCTRGSSNPGLELSLQSWVDDDYDNNLVENHQCWCLT